LMGFVGVIELAVGVAIMLGVLSRLAATGGALISLAIYFKAHFPQGWIPMMNKGELVLVYFAVFLIIMIKGNGKWNVEKLFVKKEVF